MEFKNGLLKIIFCLVASILVLANQGFLSSEIRIIFKILFEVIFFIGFYFIWSSFQKQEDKKIIKLGIWMIILYFLPLVISSVFNLDNVFINGGNTMTGGLAFDFKNFFGSMLPVPFLWGMGLIIAGILKENKGRGLFFLASALLLAVMGAVRLNYFFIGSSAIMSIIALLFSKREIIAQRINISRISSISKWVAIVMIVVDIILFVFINFLRNFPKIPFM